MRVISAIGVVTMLCLSAVPGYAQGSEGQSGTVLTFYGLRKLEQDPAVDDAKKVDEWRAFIERSRKQVAYAQKAVARWTDAARVRALKSAVESDQDAKLSPVEKLQLWEAYLEKYPKGPETKRAKKRVAHWKRRETKRLVEAAEAIERARKPKVERINSWRAVLSWVKKGFEAKAADRRISSLQQQLFQEAKSVDKIARVDAATKLEAWKDVLRGRPHAGAEEDGRSAGSRA